MAVIATVLAIVVAAIRVEAAAMGRGGGGAESSKDQRRKNRHENGTVPGHRHSPCGIDRLRCCNAVRVCCAFPGRVNRLGAFASDKTQGEYRSRYRKSLKRSIHAIVTGKSIQTTESERNPIPSRPKKRPLPGGEPDKGQARLSKVSRLRTDRSRRTGRSGRSRSTGAGDRTGRRSSR